ncbi:MFS transporter [Thalassobacillus pellis]|uniref:MFS transporter n=1 Tax=Thalassobacillus pellis TaxID=748008 RepID=UPI00196117C1|nr:MFS transporter [Thalassobacillus pellis]MBM7554099.1 putative MFS family arabinose efflux permease [Thalassobacillus pellis]
MKNSVQALVLVLCGIFIASNLYTMLPLHPALADHFATHASLTSLTSTLFISSYAVGLLFFGMLADIYSNTRLLKVGMSAVMLVTGFIALTDSLTVLCFMRAIQGFLAASFAPTAFSYTFKKFTGNTQAFVIAMINTGFLFAGIFGQLIAAHFGLTYNYQAVFILFFLLYGFCALGLFAALRPSDRFTGKNKSLSFSIILSFFRQSSLRKLYMISFFLLFTIMLFYSSFEWYMDQNNNPLGLTLQQFRMIGLIGILPSVFVRQLQTYFHPSTLLCSFLAIMVAAFLPAMFQLTTGTLLWASVLMIASTSVTIPMVILMIGKIAVHNRGSAISIYSFVLLTGASAGSFAAPFFPFHAVICFLALLFCILIMLSISAARCEKLRPSRS